MAIVETVPTEASAQREKFYDANGVQKVKGGQTKDASLVDSVVASYANLVYHPIALTFFSLGVLIFVAEAYTQAGPLELLSTFVQRETQNLDYPQLKPFFGFLIKILGIAITYKIFVGKLMLVAQSYIAKPSSRNLIYSGITLLFAIPSAVGYFEVLLLSQLLYLFVMLRAPLHKALIMIAFAAVFIIGAYEINVVAGAGIGGAATPGPSGRAWRTQSGTYSTTPATATTP